MSALRLLALLCVGLLGCTAASLPEYESVKGASHLDFICLDDVTGSPMGPLEGCGCHVFNVDESRFETLGSVECLCVEGGGGTVSFVQAETCETGVCPKRGENGDWLPATDDSEIKTVCEPQGKGKLATLIASEANRTLSVMLVDQPSSTNRLLDASGTIPGQTSHYIDDVQVGVFSYAPLRVYFSIQGIKGRLAVFGTALTVLPDYEKELGLGSIVDATVWQQSEDALGALEDGLFVLNADRTTVYEFNLEEALDPSSETLVTWRRCFTVSPAQQPECIPLPESFELNGEVISSIDVSPDGQWVLMGLSGSRRVAIFHREGVTPSIELSWLADEQACGDAYLFEQVDEQCRLRDACIVQAETGEFVWECESQGAAPPECLDGLDNDSDGLVDRFDPGCRHAIDRIEQDSESAPLCENGLDDDGDGLVDMLDPGCTPGFQANPFDYESASSCADGVDNDGDGTIDFGGDNGDVGCSHAGDHSEHPEDTQFGVTRLGSLYAPRFGPNAWQITLVDEQGGIFAGLLSGDSLIQSGGSPEANVNLLAVRQTVSRGESITLDWDGALDMWSFERRQRLTVDEAELFGARPGYTELSTTLWSRMQSGYGGGFEFVYQIKDGKAFTHSGLAEICAASSCDSNSECAVGGECLEGVCVASQCTSTPCTDGSSCINEVCLPDCDTDADCSDAHTCHRGQCVNVCAADEDGLHIYRGVELALDDSSWFETPVLFKGASDPTLYKKSSQVGGFERIGTRRTAALATNQLTGVPTYSLNGRSQAFDPNTTLFFCNMNIAEGANQEDLNGVSCAPSGFIEEFGGYRRMSLTERDSLYPAALTSFDEVSLNAEYFSSTDRTLDFYELSFEGVIPATESKFGVHGGDHADGWTLVDPKADFCSKGIEPGDMVIVERFRMTESGSLDTCAPWVTPDLSGSPEQRLEPLRYRVSSVGVRSLELIQDTRTSYNQSPRSINQQSPHPAVALPAPPVSCVRPGFTYHVRVSDNHWLVTNGLEGYRHPWRRNGSVCQKDARDGESSRFTLGEIFDDGRVRFKLGYPISESFCDDAPCLPYMLGTVMSFGVSNRDLGKTGGLSIGAASEMKWSAFDDRLYVLDVAGETVLQVGGLSIDSSVYREQNRLQ